MFIEDLDLPKSKVKQLMEKGIETVEDLAAFMPSAYHDFRKPTPIQHLEPGTIQCVVGTLSGFSVTEKLVRGTLVDAYGGSMNVIWFNASYMRNHYAAGDKIIVAGKVEVSDFRGVRSLQFTNPMLCSKAIEENQQIVAVYPKVSGMSQDYLKKCIALALEAVKTESIEKEILGKYQVSGREQGYQGIHFPRSMDDVEQGKKRYVLDQLLTHALDMELQHGGPLKDSPFVPSQMTFTKDLVSELPFTLTDGQKEALNGIYEKMKEGKRVDALVQGDVGCGKTIIAVLLMFMMAENGYQSTLMAPTGVLGKQHYEDFVKFCEGTPYSVAYLSGETKAKEKRAILKSVKDGTVHFLVGTHAVIQKDVEFQSLGLTVVDEEHRFGVQQRNALKQKAVEGVHHVAMSATPIPRSLALVAHGENVQVHTIQSMPSGRQPVRTVLFGEDRRAFNGILQQVQAGHQAYVVCPLIEDSKSEAMAGVESVEATYEKLVKGFRSHPEVKVGMINGQMKPAEVAETLEQFTNNELNVLVSTTIIEVGVNVPNATLIVIKNAERFGLAQLHQLRGRVGRSSLPSYCIMVSEKTNNPKLRVMTQTNSGFDIAKADLDLRGSGDLTGNKQSGENKQLDLLKMHLHLYLSLKKDVLDIVVNAERLAFYKRPAVVESECVS